MLSKNNLKQFKDRHKGKKALLLCNGPSLNKVNFSRIDTNQFTLFGLNKIFLGFDKFSIKPDYLVAVNKKVLEQSVKEYNNLDIIKFISNRIDPQLIPENQYTYHINTIHLPKPCKRFNEDMSEYVFEGWTVTHAALQIIYYMGFIEVYIIGMDHRFSQHVQGMENKPSVIQGDDIDHFDPHYFGHGQTWDFPDLKNNEISYRVAREIFNQNGREIYDCTIDGACTVFPKIPIEFLYTQNHELSPYIQLSSITTSPNLRSITENNWRYTKSDDLATWTATFNVEGNIVEQILVASIYIKSDVTIQITVNFTHDTIDITDEPNKHLVTANTRQLIQLDKTVSQSATTLKVQLTINNTEHDVASLTIPAVHIDIFPVATLRKCVDLDKMHLKMANQLFKQKQYESALDIYLLLYTQRPLQIYLNNALMCARKMQLKSMHTFKDLLQQMTVMS